MFEFFERRSFAKQRIELQPPGLQQRCHLHPGFVHAAPVNSLNGRALENHIIDQVQRNIFRRNPQ
jgi:hypothetical protein